MCEPMTIAAVGLGAGALVGAAGQIRAGRFQAQVAENNARLAEYQRGDAIHRGAIEAKRLENAGQRMGEAARVLSGGAGVGGKSVDAQELASAANVARDATTIRANATRAAWGLTQQAQDYRAQGREAKMASYFGAAGQMLGGAGSTGLAFK